LESRLTEEEILVRDTAQNIVKKIFYPEF